MRGAAVPWVAWIRRVGAAWAPGRPKAGWPWQMVAVERSQAEARAAAARERATRPWVFALTTVLRKGERPEVALWRK